MKQGRKNLANFTNYSEVENSKGSDRETFYFYQLENKSIKKLTINGVALISLPKAYTPCFVFYEEGKAKKIDRNSKVLFQRKYPNSKGSGEYLVNFYSWDTLSEDIISEN